MSPAERRHVLEATHGRATRRRRGRRAGPRTAASGLVAGALLAVGLGAVTAPAPAATLYASAAGPVDNATGYPFWFEDNAGMRLELCVDDEQDPLCPVVGERPDPAAPLSLPENFPDESFWWAAEAEIDTGGVRARLILAQEAAFGGSEEVVGGQQVAFSRLRIRIDDLRPGAVYQVTTPYGERNVVADDRGRVFHTEDQGCLSPPCDFGAGLDGQVGPFLRWDTGAPAGYVGDPNVEHAVTGSPTGTNYFRVRGPGAGGAGVDTIRTNLFTVQGRIAQPRATVSEPGDLYVTGTPIELTSSFPGESTIYYTTDGSDPTTSATRMVYSEPYLLPAGDTTMSFVVEHAGAFSEVYTESYTARDEVSTVSATPSPAVAPAVLEGRQDVALTASTTSVATDGTVTETPTEGDIYYTTNGSRPSLDESGDPVAGTQEYTDPIPISRTTMVRAVSVPDVGEPGPVRRFPFVIHNLRTVGPVGQHGYPTELTDIGLPGATPTDPRQDPVTLELCLDDPLCPVVGERPDPLRPTSFPGNFPDESFWWSGEAQLADRDGERLRLVLAMEAAFDADVVQDGHQIAFGRIRVRYDGAVPGATYEVVHPYGVVRATADDTGRLFYTDDNGCMNGPCGDFGRVLTQPVGPFLRWDTGAPEGYVGDPTIEHAVVGSPYGTNEFTVHQVTDGLGAEIAPVLIGSTDQFAVQGKISDGVDGPPLPDGATLRQAVAGPINAGGTATLQGVLSPGGRPLAGVPVVLQAAAAAVTDGGATAQRVAADWADVATTTTAVDGSFAFRAQPSVITEYRVLFAGDSTRPQVVSAVLAVGVRGVVTMARPDPRVRRGERTTFRGSLRPALQGRQVVVRLAGPGRHADRALATVNRTGSWRVTVRAPRTTGRWTARAVSPRDGTLLRGVSGTRTFRVTR